MIIMTQFLQASLGVIVIDSPPPYGNNEEERQCSALEGGLTATSQRAQSMV